MASKISCWSFRGSGRPLWTLQLLVQAATYPGYFGVTAVLADPNCIVPCLLWLAARGYLSCG